jgi:glycerol uptake operon antiterminator
VVEQTEHTTGEAEGQDHPPIRTNGLPRDRDLRFRESIQKLTSLLEQTRVIPAVRGPELLVRAARAPGKIVYFLFGDPEEIGEMADVALAYGKVPIVNLDLASGLARDHAAVAFLARRKIQGIISTHPEPLRAARELGLFAIKRTFLLDSAALQGSLKSLDQFLPDALEVLPATTATHIVSKLAELHPMLPVIAGGLVRNLREVDDLVRSGVSSVSVSDANLWIA